MCGGAVISDYIPPGVTRRLTADYLWPDLNSAKTNKGNSGYSKPLRSKDDDDYDDTDADKAFEADFLDFKDESDEETFMKSKDSKPFSFGVFKPKQPINGMSLICFFLGGVLLFLFI